MKIFFYVFCSLLVLCLLIYLCFFRQINLFIVAITGKKRIQKNLYRSCKMYDYLILNDLYLPIGENKYKYIDTIIFGNKYIYIIKEVKQAGEIKISPDDQKWRVIYHKQLTLIDNPLIYNRKVISYLVNMVESLENKDLKNMVILTKTCQFEKVNYLNNEFVISEKEAIKKINEIEKNSNDDILDPKEIERYCNAFYQYGLKAESEIKKYK